MSSISETSSRRRQSVVKVYLPPEVRGMPDAQPTPTTDIYRWIVLAHSVPSAPGLVKSNIKCSHARFFANQTLTMRFYVTLLQLCYHTDWDSHQDGSIQCTLSAMHRKNSIHAHIIHDVQDEMSLDSNWKPKIKLSDLTSEDCPCPHEYMDVRNESQHKTNVQLCN